MTTSGWFDAGPLRFVVDDGYAPIGTPGPLTEVEVDDLDHRLMVSGVVPALDGAPLASWLLARLQSLTRGGGLGFHAGVVEHISGAVWVVDLVAVSEGRPVAKLQVQGGMIGAGILGVATSEGDLSRMVDAFVDAVLVAPNEVSVVEVSITDPDWLEAPADYDPEPTPDTVCRFGYDGARYLGAGNVRRRAS